MITLNEFVERSKTTWMLARGIIQCCDDPDNPSEFKLDLNNPMHRQFKRKIERMGVGLSDIKYHIAFLCSPSVGYKFLHVYIRADKSVLCAEFGSCSETFLRITNELGMVNGISYQSRKHLEFENAEVFFF